MVLSKDRLADMERTIATNDGVAESLKQEANRLKKELEDAESARAKTREDATAQVERCFTTVTTLLVVKGVVVMR